MIDLGSYGCWPGHHVDVHPDEWPPLVAALTTGKPHPMLDHLTGVLIRFHPPADKETTPCADS